MKKITTVLIAMLLLTLSVLAAHADQEGNARWCNIDNHGCYLNEADGSKSYMHFWSVASCKHYMGNDNPCNNVVARYDKDPYRLPLEPAPEPVVYKQAAVKTITELYTIPVTIIQMISGEEMFQIMFPEGVAEFNGVMIVTDLDSPQEDGNQPLVSLETAGTGEELMIPVYIPKEGFTQDNFYSNFRDFRPMTAELSDSGKAALLGGGAESKNSFLIPYETNEEMNSYLNDALKENFRLAGYVSSSGVGVSPQPDRHMEAKHVDSGHEESGSSDSGSETKNDQTGGSLAVQFSNNEFDKSSESINLPGGASSNTDDNSYSGTYLPTGFNQSMYGGVLTISSNAVLEVERTNSGNAVGGAVSNNPFGSNASVLIIGGAGSPASNDKNGNAGRDTIDLLLGSRKDEYLQLKDAKIVDVKLGDNPVSGTGGAIYLENSGKAIPCTFVDNNGNPINGSVSASGNGNVNDGKLSGGELTPEDKHLSGDLSGYGQISGENITARQIISKIKFISGKKKLMITGADGISIQSDITAKLINNSEARFDTNLDKDPAISERYQRIDSHIIELGVGYRF